MALVAAGEKVQAAPTSPRTRRSEDTESAVLGRGEPSSTPKMARIEDCEMDEWNEMITGELLDRRDRKKKNISMPSLELKLQRETWDQQKTEQREKERKA